MRAREHAGGLPTGAHRAVRIAWPACLADHLLFGTGS
jgi:hypothetical protein